jgi:hypothetical protein
MRTEGLMTTEPALAFISVHETPALEIRVNFGVFSGRQATPAEIDDLARALLPDLQEVSIVAEERHEISEDVEASLHTVRVEVAEEHLPPDEEGRRDLAETLTAACERWAQACIADRHVEVAEQP